MKATLSPIATCAAMISCLLLEEWLQIRHQNDYVPLTARHFADSIKEFCSSTPSREIRWEMIKKQKKKECIKTSSIIRSHFRNKKPKRVKRGIKKVSFFWNMGDM
jgi:hypothetical protein